MFITVPGWGVASGSCGGVCVPNRLDLSSGAVVGRVSGVGWSVARASATFVCMEDAGSGVGTSAATVALMDACICCSAWALASAVSVATLGWGVAVTYICSGAWVHPSTADIVTMISTTIEIRTGFRTFLIPGFPSVFRRELGGPCIFSLPGGGEI